MAFASFDARVVVCSRELDILSCISSVVPALLSLSELDFGSVACSVNVERCLHKGAEWVDSCPNR